MGDDPESEHIGSQVGKSILRRVSSNNLQDLQVPGFIARLVLRISHLVIIGHYITALGDEFSF